MQEQSLTRAGWGREGRAGQEQVGGGGRGEQYLSDAKWDVAHVEAPGLSGHLAPDHGHRRRGHGQTIRRHGGEKGSGWDLTRSFKRGRKRLGPIRARTQGRPASPLRSPLACSALQHTQEPGTRTSERPVSCRQPHRRSPWVLRTSPPARRLQRSREQKAQGTDLIYPLRHGNQGPLQPHAHTGPLVASPGAAGAYLAWPCTAWG